MSLQSNKRSQTKSSSARRKDIYKKSKYYQEKRQKLLIATGIGIFVLVFILILAGIRGCSNYISSRQAAAKKTVSMNASEDSSQKASSDSQNTDSSNATVSSPVSLTLSVVGDCTLGTDETFDYDTSLNAYYENYGADYFLQNVRSIFSADDLTIANFEGTLTDSDEREDKTFAFKAPASYASILSGSSVEAVNTANNHSHDYGDQGYEDTISALDSAGILNFGYDKTIITEVKGIKVGLVGIYELKDHLERKEQLKQNIAKVKSEGAQITIVIFHWGNEKEEVPDSNQTTLAHLAIDEGADLVCGHHPHVLQGIEEYKGKNIVYSLGNFCFGGNQYPSDMDTMIFQQTFTVDQNGVKADNVTNIIPCSVSSDSDYNNYQPTPAEGDEAARILNKIQERTAMITGGTASTSESSEDYDSSDNEEDSSYDDSGYEEDYSYDDSSDYTEDSSYDDSYDYAEDSSYDDSYDYDEDSSYDYTEDTSYDDYSYEE